MGPFHNWKSACLRLFQSLFLAFSRELLPVLLRLLVVVLPDSTRFQADLEVVGSSMSQMHSLQAMEQCEELPPQMHSLQELQTMTMMLMDLRVRQNLTRNFALL